MVFVSISFSMLITSGIKAPARALSFQTNSVAPHVIAATKILTTNFRMSFEYAPTESDDSETEDKSMGSFDREETVKCMYLGSQLNALQASLSDEKREEHRSVFNLPLLMNLLVGDGWKEGIFPPDDITEKQQSEDGDGGIILSAIRFVLMKSLRDMAQYSVKDRTPQLDNTDSSLKTQRMSRATAASLPPTLALLRRLISRQLVLGSQVSSTLSKMKDSDFASLITELPDTSTSPKFNAAQFTRAFHLKLAKLSYEVYSDERFSCAPSHVIYPWMQYLSEVIGGLEEASKVVEPSPTSATTAAERPSSIIGGRMNDPSSLLGLLQGLGPGPGPGSRREESAEPFEPSEEAIAQLSEMGFGRDHAAEALEMAGTNRVEVAMEYALTHPPSSPATLERRRAAREQRRQQQQQRRNESERQSSTNEDPPSAGNSSSSNVDGTTQNQASESSESSKDKEEDESKPKPKPPLTEDELKAKREKEIEESSAAEAKKFLLTVKDSLVNISVQIIESSMGPNAKADSDTAGQMVAEQQSNVTNEKEPLSSSDSQDTIIIMSNFLLYVSKLYPELESKVASELCQRLKGCIDLKSPSHCRVKSGCESRFAALSHSSVVIFRSLPKLRPVVLRHGLVGMLTHCVRNCTLTSALRGGKGVTQSSDITPMVWPTWLAPVLLLLEVMAQPTSVTLDDEGGEEAGLSKPANKKSEYCKLLVEHERISKKQTSTMKHVYSFVTNKDAGKQTPKKKKGESKKKQTDTKSSDSDKKESSDGTTSADGEGEEDKQKAKVQPPTPSVPPIPLLQVMMHTETQEACMKLCLQLLGLKSKKGVIDKAHLEKVCPSPIVVNGKCPSS